MKGLTVTGIVCRIVLTVELVLFMFGKIELSELSLVISAIWLISHMVVTSILDIKRDFEDSYSFHI